MSFPLKELILQSGNVFKNIVTEVLHECSDKNVKLSPDIISYCVILFFLNPKLGISDVFNINRSNVETFIKNCVEKISDSDMPYIKSLRLQFTFLNAALNFDEAASLYSSLLSQKVNNLFRDIIDTPATTKEEQDKLFKKIIFDIIIFNKLGKPSNHKVITEVTNALKSVMSREEFNDFIKLSRSKRFETLKSLRKTVCGIMIFNNDDGECGDEMRDIVKDVSLAYTKTKFAITDTYNRTTITLKEYNRFLRNLIQINEKNHEITFAHSNLDDIATLEQALQLYSQHEYYLKLLLQIIVQIRYNIDDLIQKWQKTLRNLHDIVQYRMSVPTEAVFPHFVDLSSFWHSLWNFLYLLVDIHKLNESMSEIIVLDTHLDIKKIFEKYNTATTDDVTAFFKKNISFCQNIEGCEWVAYSSEIASQLTAAHQYCAYVIAIGNGLLFPSNLNIGLLKYNNRLYSFSDIKYAKCFATNKELFENQYMLSIQDNSHLIYFFDLHDTIKNYKFVKVSTKKSDGIDVEEKIKSIETQTEIHPIPYYKEKDYTWNIWDLRRKALQLTHIKKCNTHSAQTEISYYRNSINLQTIKLVPQKCQTKNCQSTSTDGDC